MPKKAPPLAETLRVVIADLTYLLALAETGRLTVVELKAVGLHLEKSARVIRRELKPLKT